MNHSHAYSHSHSSAHRGCLILTLIITTTTLIAEIVGAYWTLSLALLADAGHMLTDVTRFTIAVTTASLIEGPAISERTWGLHRVEVPTVGTQAAVLLRIGTFAFTEGIERLVTPRPITSVGLLVFDIVGLVGNVASILILANGRGANLNMRAAFLEVVGDALGSVIAIASVAITVLADQTRANATTGVLIAAFIVPGAITIIREAESTLMESTPRGLDLSEVHEHLSSVPHILDVHDLHAYKIAMDPSVLAARIVLADERFADGHAITLPHQFQDCVAEHFLVSIEHSTFQFESRTHTEHEISGCRH